jgi:hypothetical protein
MFLALPVPDPIVRGKDTRIRIRTKKSQIPNTGRNNIIHGEKACSSLQIVQLSVSTIYRKAYHTSTKYCIINLHSNAKSKRRNIFCLPVELRIGNLNAPLDLDLELRHVEVF